MQTKTSVRINDLLEKTTSFYVNSKKMSLWHFFSFVSCLSKISFVQLDDGGKKETLVIILVFGLILIVNYWTKKDIKFFVNLKAGLLLAQAIKFCTPYF